MLVIQAANGNTYPAETCVWRTEQLTSGGYRLTHFSIHSPNVPTSGGSSVPTVAPTGSRLGYIGKSGRFVAYTEPAA
jgi:hypothetical protein